MNGMNGEGHSLKMGIKERRMVGRTEKGFAGVFI
jgi:hypothetical protein